MDFRLMFMFPPRPTYIIAKTLTNTTAPQPTQIFPASFQGEHIEIHLNHGWTRMNTDGDRGKAPCQNSPGQRPGSRLRIATRAESQRQYPDMPFGDADFQPAQIITIPVPRALPWAIMTLAVGEHPKKGNPFFRWIFMRSPCWNCRQSHTFPVFWYIFCRLKTAETIHALHPDA
jgi:hypothetical protein